MAEGVSRRTVAFAGEGSGEGELSWGQLDVWLKMRRFGRTFAMGGARALPSGTTVDVMAGELAYLMSRYQTMRTRLDLSGPLPRQIVHASGAIELEIVTGGSPQDIVVRYQTTPFDYEEDWPVRMAVLVDGDRCTHAVLVISHLVFDGAGAMVMMAETSARVAEPVTGTAPLEQARQQQLPSARRHNAAALRHWERSLRSMPLPVMRETAGCVPRYHTGTFRSTTLPRALRVAADRHGTDTAPALLAAFAMAFAKVTGVTVVPFRLMSSNRFRAGFDGVVCPVSQNGLCVLDTNGTFGEVLLRARGASMTAVKYAYYDRQELDARIAEVVADRGPAANLDVNFNDRRFGGSLRPASAPAGDDSEFVWQKADDEPLSGFFVNVDGSDEVLEMTVHLDTRFLSPADAEAVLFAMEIVAAA